MGLGSLTLSKPLKSEQIQKSEELAKMIVNVTK